MTEISTTAVFPPPRPGLPFLAVVFGANSVIHAVRPFATEHDAHHFLQAFMQENAGEHEFPSDNVWMGGGS